ncbi:hypothetical protein [Burkholderia stagnalis]
MLDEHWGLEFIIGGPSPPLDRDYGRYFAVFLVPGSTRISMRDEHRRARRHSEPKLDSFAGEDIVSVDPNLLLDQKASAPQSTLVRAPCRTPSHWIWGRGTLALFAASPWMLLLPESCSLRALLAQIAAYLADKRRFY